MHKNCRSRENTGPKRGLRDEDTSSLLGVEREKQLQRGKIGMGKCVRSWVADLRAEAEEVSVWRGQVKFKSLGSHVDCCWGSRLQYLEPDHQNPTGWKLPLLELLVIDTLFSSPQKRKK